MIDYNMQIWFITIRVCLIWEPQQAEIYIIYFKDISTILKLSQTYFSTSIFCFLNVNWTTQHICDQVTNISVRFLYKDYFAFGYTTMFALAIIYERVFYNIIC